MVYEPTFMAYKLPLLRHTVRTPTSMPYEPFSLGVGVVFGLLTFLWEARHPLLTRKDFLWENFCRSRNEGRPNHDHDHFWAHLGAPRFSILGYPRMRHQMPFDSTQWNTERKHKDLSADVPSTAVLMRHQMQNLFGKAVEETGWPSLAFWGIMREAKFGFF